jgi:hypothetical protein
MVRRLGLIVGLVVSLVAARPASAGPVFPGELVAPVDLDRLSLGSQIGDVTNDFTMLFGWRMFGWMPSTGTAETKVFFDGVNYVYTQTVTTDGHLNMLFGTQFDVIGFTGQAGWSFGEADALGAKGDDLDFRIQNIAGQLLFISMPGGAFGHWNAFEPITFFFTSTKPPTLKNYGLFSLMPMEFGSVSGLAPGVLAPVPEPGSIALFGSGLVWLYARMRRRRNLKM